MASIEKSAKRRASKRAAGSSYRAELERGEFDWNGMYVLLRVDDDDPENHRVQMYRRQPGAIGPNDNAFDAAPWPVPKAEFARGAELPPPPWLVALPDDPGVLMGVYQLRRLN